MNTITYNNNLVSQYHMREKAFNNKNPIHEEIKKCLGKYEFTATFERDTGTIDLLKEIPGIIAFTCKISRGDKIVGIGWGSSVINKANRFVERSVRSALNGSMVDAIIRSTKILDSFHPNAISQLQGTDVGLAGITGKQKNYLLELIQTNITDKNELRHWESKIDGLSKDEASEAIQSLKG